MAGIRHIIKSVAKKSVAADYGLEPGDEIVSINGEAIKDVFDYRFMILEEELELEINTKDGENVKITVEKDPEEDLGIEFENSFMDNYRSCHNKCIFCFIDQMPKGMRETLYFKDDDSRLSFLQGNYVTLTNLSDEDMNRIIKYRLEPINISFQTMNPELRCKMLGNRFAGDALKKAYTFKENGIIMNGQIVLCKGINDGEELDYSLSKMYELLPELESVSIVPVGLSKFREGLYPLEPFNKEDANEVIDIIHKWQDKAMEKYGTHFAHPSDEWYILAGRDIPDADFYDGYQQLENGVGMIRSFIDDFDMYLDEVKAKAKSNPFFKAKVNKKREYSFATGRLFAPILKELSNKYMESFPNTVIHVFPIRNDFFGEMITVAGLITGKDLINQLKGENLGEKLFLPSVMFRYNEEVMLDDLTRSDVESALQIPTYIIKSSGRDMIDTIIYGDSNGKKKT